MYNKKVIMSVAWSFMYTGRSTDMSDALRKAWSNIKTINAAKNGRNLNTWYGWRKRGRAIKRGSKCVAQATLYDAYTKKGTRVVSFFALNQTCEIEED